MKIIAMAGNLAALPTLDHLIKTKQLTTLICPANSEAPEINFLESWASDCGLPCWQMEQNSLESELSELIHETSPDLVLVFGFTQHLPIPVLQQVKHGAWNVQVVLHPSNQGSITIHRLTQNAEGEEKPLHESRVTLLPPNEAGSPIYQLGLLCKAILNSLITNLKNSAQECL